MDLTQRIMKITSDSIKELMTDDLIEKQASTHAKVMDDPYDTYAEEDFKSGANWAIKTILQLIG